MNKFFYAVLLCTGICGLVACSNGDYKADPNSNVNNAVNPITPLTSSEFTWSGDAPMSANINGNYWKASDVTFGLDSSANIIVGTGGGKTIYFHMQDVWSGSVYPLVVSKTNNYYRYAYYSDSVSFLQGGPYYSNLDNSGGIKIVENDSAVIIGYFYFKGANIQGKEVSITNGYFKINKF